MIYKANCSLFQDSSQKYQRFGVQIVHYARHYVRFGQEAHVGESPEQETWEVRQFPRRSRPLH